MQASELRMDIIDMVRTADGGIRISPRLSTIVTGFVAGAVLIAIGGGIIFVGTGLSLDFTSTCVLPLSGLALAGMGASAIAYGARGLSVPTVDISTASKTVSIRASGQTKTIPVSEIKQITSASFGRFWSILSAVSTTLTAFLGAHGAETGKLFEAVRFDLELADGQSVMLTIVEHNRLTEFRWFVSAALPMI